MRKSAEKHRGKKNTYKKNEQGILHIALLVSLTTYVGKVTQNMHLPG